MECSQRGRAVLNKANIGSERDLLTADLAESARDTNKSMVNVFMYQSCVGVSVSMPAHHIQHDLRYA